MGWWIQPAPGASKWNDLKGTLVMIGALAVMVVGFYFVAKYVGADTKVPHIWFPTSSTYPAAERNIVIWIIIPILTAIIFALWFSPLGLKVGIWRWPK
jgi:heme/copper-type cytochrome/quinol oxidase subunit 2